MRFILMLSGFALFFAGFTAQAGLRDLLSDLGFDPYSRASAKTCAKSLIYGGRGSVDGPRQALARLVALIESGSYQFKSVEAVFLQNFGKFTTNRDETERLFQLWVRFADKQTLEELLKIAPNVAGEPHQNTLLARLIFDVAAKLHLTSQIVEYFDRMPLASRTHVLTSSYAGNFGEDGRKIRARLGIPLNLEMDRITFLEDFNDVDRFRAVLETGRLSLQPGHGGFRDRSTYDRLAFEEASDHTRFSNPQIRALYTLHRHRLRYALTIHDPAIDRMHNMEFRRHILPVGFDGLPDPQTKVENLYGYCNAIITIVRDLKESGTFENYREEYLMAIANVDPVVIEFFTRYFPGIVEGLEPNVVRLKGLDGTSFDYPLTVQDTL